MCGLWSRVRREELAGLSLRSRRKSQKPVGSPCQVGDLGDKLRLDPMHAGKERAADRDRGGRRPEARLPFHAGNCTDCKWLKPSFRAPPTYKCRSPRMALARSTSRRAEPSRASRIEVDAVV